MIEQETLYREVVRIIADVLGVDVAEISSQDRFFQDLGGESIDVLDLGFQCEKRYGVKFSFQEMIDPKKFDVDSDGQLSATALSELGTRFPFLNVASIVPTSTHSFAAAERKELFSSLFTVEAIVGFVAQTISRKAITPEFPHVS